MKQFIISRCRQAWGTEYSVADYRTKETALRALHNGGFKDKIDAYGGDGALNFTMQCRDLFGLTYDVISSRNSVMGLLAREAWLSPPLRVTDAACQRTAQAIKVSPSLYEEFTLEVDEKVICLFRKADTYSTPVICCCLDDSQIDLRLMFASGILILGQGPADVGGAAG